MKGIKVNNKLKAALGEGEVVWAQYNSTLQVQHRGAMSLKQACICLTDDACYYLDTTSPVHRIPYIHLQDVSHDYQRDPHAYYLTWFNNFSSHYRTTSYSNFRSFCTTPVMCFACREKNDAVEASSLIRHLVDTAWQRLFETQLVLEPDEIYKAHWQILKINRRKIAQERTLVLSNAYIYNVVVVNGEKGMMIEKKKWAMPIGELVHIDLDPPFGQKFKGKSMELQFTKAAETRFKTGSRKNSTHRFVFRSKKARFEAANELSRLYCVINAENLDVINFDKLVPTRTDLEAHLG